MLYNKVLLIAHDMRVEVGYMSPNETKNTEWFACDDWWDLKYEVGVKKYI